MLTQINCPRCQTPFNAEIHQVVDVERNPQLKYELLNGTLNLFTCPNCGTTGQLATPILYHDPEHEIFMVHIPMEMNLPHQEQQKLIGKLVQEAMNQIPPEQRRGYMLQPQEILSYQTFMEKILETEGITPDMIARQREQAKLLQTMISADRGALDSLIEENADKIDETFFAILRSAVEAAQQRDDKDLLKLTNLQAKLYTQTDLGRELERRQSVLRQFQKDVRKNEGLTPEILLKHILQHYDDEGTVDALVAMGQAALSYEFFNQLTQEIERQARQKNKEKAKALTGLRQRLLDLHNEMQEQSREILEGAMSTLQDIVDAPDTEEAIRDNLGRIDDTFMYVLSAMIAQNEQQGREEQAEELKHVQDLILAEAERQVPPQIRVINRLLRAESDADQRRILEENRNLLTPELLQMLEALSQEMATQPDGEATEMVGRINKLKAMVEARI
ncbi:MAG TPA: CpXC domain-containing protein [Candidatus Binatia bacterium]|jgi:predicted transcriptional regulator|nr:CpXC domain-containing protein [Candidatus Binatia bacterium]